MDLVDGMDRIDNDSDNIEEIITSRLIDLDGESRDRIGFILNVFSLLLVMIKSMTQCHINR